MSIDYVNQLMYPHVDQMHQKGGATLNQYSPNQLYTNTTKLPTSRDLGNKATPHDTDKLSTVTTNLSPRDTVNQDIPTHRRCSKMVKISEI